MSWRPLRNIYETKWLMKKKTKTKTKKLNFVPCMQRYFEWLLHSRLFLYCVEVGGGGGEEEGEGSDRSGVITRATDLYEVAILHMVLMGLLRTFCQG